MKHCIKNLLSCPKFLFGIMIVTSALTLAMAFISEGFLGLEPCQLCIYQRYPFALAVIIGLIGLFLRKRITAARTLLGLASLNFLANSAIATYHTGVEQHWWTSEVEGCSTPFMAEPENQSFLENIMSAPLGSCSEIPWADPLLGLSMANYNIVWCLILALFFAAGAFLIKDHSTKGD